MIRKQKLKILSGELHHKILSREEEVELFKKIEKGDETAKREIEKVNWGLVLSIAESIVKKYSNTNPCPLRIDEMSSIGFGESRKGKREGLVRAIEKFDWRKGYKFSTFAYWWIEKAILKGIADRIKELKRDSFEEIDSKVDKPDDDYKYDLQKKAERVKNEFLNFIFPLYFPLKDLMKAGDKTFEDQMIMWEQTKKGIERKWQIYMEKIGEKLSDKELIKKFKTKNRINLSREIKETQMIFDFLSPSLKQFIYPARSKATYLEEVYLILDKNFCPKYSGTKKELKMTASDRRQLEKGKWFRLTGYRPI